MAPDTPVPIATPTAAKEDEDAERLILEAAVQEAREQLRGGETSTPHAEVRAEMLRFADAMRQRVEVLRRRA